MKQCTTTWTSHTYICSSDVQKQNHLLDLGICWIKCICDNFDNDMSHYSLNIWAENFSTINLIGNHRILQNRLQLFILYTLVSTAVTYLMYYTIYIVSQFGSQSAKRKATCCRVYMYDDIWIAVIELQPNSISQSLAKFQKDAYPDIGFSWFSSVSPHDFGDSAL